jgi:hypothetical protein
MTHDKKLPALSASDRAADDNRIGYKSVDQFKRFVSSSTFPA